MNDVNQLNKNIQNVKKIKESYVKLIISRLMYTQSSSSFFY